MLLLRNALIVAVLVAGVALLAGCRQARAAACAPLGPAEKTLWRDWGELRANSGLTKDGRQVFVTENKETGSWTILIISPPDPRRGLPAIACAFLAGDNWRPEAPPPPDEEGS